MTVGSSEESLSGFDTSDNLDAFSNDFFGKAQPEPEADSDKEEITDEPVADEVELETDETVEDADVTDESEEDLETEEVEEKPKKKTAQDRIKELTAQRYEAERASNARIAELERKLTELATPKEPEKPTIGKLPDGAPDPLAELPDGTLLYPMGEYDPKYQHDLIRFTIKAENDAATAYRQKAEQEAAVNAARDTARAGWVEKLTEAQAEIPDIETKIMSLDSVVANVDMGYQQYLIDVIMSLDNGPRVMAYLADNPSKASEIVRSGAASATVALGRLDGRMAKPPVQAKTPTQAPRPPVNTPRGTSGKFATRADTDDLDAFSNTFFKKK